MPAERTETEPEPDVWRCETCAFWEPFGGFENGICRRLPPVIYMSPADDVDEVDRTGWQPEMLPEERCGEWSDVPPPAVRAARQRAGGFARGGAS